MQNVCQPAIFITIVGYFSKANCIFSKNPQFLCKIFVSQLEGGALWPKPLQKFEKKHFFKCYKQGEAMNI